jgi:hypothetical protein
MRYDLHEKLEVFSFVEKCKMKFNNLFRQEDKLNEIAYLPGCVRVDKST